MQLYRFLTLLTLLVMLAGCDEISDTSTRAAEDSKRVLYEAKERWKDLLTYSPRKSQSQLPQTRYCYRMQTDIVCYDSPQVDTTAPMVGYQDGQNTSWFQPGGGSVGFSGGPATSIYAGPPVMTTPAVTASAPAKTAPAKTAAAAPNAGVAPSPQAGEIDVTANPPPFKKQVK